MAATAAGAVATVGAATDITVTAGVVVMAGAGATPVGGGAPGRRRITGATPIITAVDIPITGILTPRTIMGAIEQINGFAIAERAERGPNASGVRS